MKFFQPLTCSSLSFAFECQNSVDCFLTRVNNQVSCFFFPKDMSLSSDFCSLSLGFKIFVNLFIPLKNFFTWKKKNHFDNCVTGHKFCIIVAWAVYVSFLYTVGSNIWFFLTLSFIATYSPMSDSKSDYE